MTRIDADVIVVGAGLSGLTTAFRLARRGWQVAVVEAAERPGGVIGSRRREGVLYELGPNSGLDTTPLIDELLAAAGIRGERIDASAAAAKRYILRGGALMAMPTSPGAFFGTPLFSWRAKLALLREPFVSPAPADAEETVADFVRRRLGAEFLDYAIEPFVAGIYAGDPETLSVPAAFPRLAALEQKYGSLIRGQILGARERRKNADKAKNVAVSFSFRDGMQTLTDALARKLPIECGVRVAAVRREAEGFALECERGSAGSKQCFERRARGRARGARVRGGAHRRAARRRRRAGARSDRLSPGCGRCERVSPRRRGASAGRLRLPRAEEGKPADPRIAVLQHDVRAPRAGKHGTADDLRRRPAQPGTGPGRGG
jgi:oxygen-dependent protoporphyrinogen oxidase